MQLANTQSTREDCMHTGPYATKCTILSLFSVQSKEIFAATFLYPHSISLHLTPPLYQTPPPCKGSGMGCPPTLSKLELP